MITERQRYEYNPPDTPLNILYIDDDILVADKPSGLLSVPGKQSDDSLTLRLRELYPDVNPVHRLDTATSGVILFSPSLIPNR
jgi:tRNA pseudouridine32 synthase/23S rRNA pseudouridine746 synthase